MAKSSNIRVKRGCDAAAPGEGRRVPVDRLWPRGVSGDAPALSLGARDAARNNAVALRRDPVPKLARRARPRARRNP
jgi:uncharacterized protein YeaO (DUF488 family)